MRNCRCSDQKEIEEKVTYMMKEAEGIILELEPLTEEVNLDPYMKNGQIFKVVCGGDVKENGIVCRHEWILSVREQCMRNRVEFEFRTTGCCYEKEGKQYTIPKHLQKIQAIKAALNYDPAKELFDRLGHSDFRSRFTLNNGDRKYIEEKGIDEIEKHARKFIESRLVPEDIPNDGKQTPMRGHPVFKAQHGTGTCCRGCLEKWHDIRKGHKLTEKEENYVIYILMRWIIMKNKNKMK